MGSPISCILAEIFIHYIERTHKLNQQNNKYEHKIIYLYIYVDIIIPIKHEKQTNRTTRPQHLQTSPKIKFHFRNLS